MRSASTSISCRAKKILAENNSTIFNLFIDKRNMKKIALALSVAKSVEVSEFNLNRAVDTSHNLKHPIFGRCVVDSFFAHSRYSKFLDQKVYYLQIRFPNQKWTQNLSVIRLSAFIITNCPILNISLEFRVKSRIMLYKTFKF